MTQSMLAILALVAICSILGTLLYVERQKKQVSRPQPPHPASDRVVSDGESLGKGDALQFASANGQASFTISVPPRKLMKSLQWKEVEFGSRSASWFQPHISQASELLRLPILARLGSFQTYHVAFKGTGELMRAKAGDGFRATLVDKNTHHIVSQGVITPVNNPANMLLVWEGVAAIVGRKFLADISRSLKQLRNSVEGIEDFLREERIGTLQADCSEVERIAEQIRRNPGFLYQNPVFQNTLEQVERNASAVARASLLELQRIAAQLRDLSDLTGWRTAPAEQIEEPADKALDALRVASFALLLRSYCCALMGSYVEDSSLRNMRSSDITDLLQRIDAQGQLCRSNAETKAGELDELFRFEENVEAKRRALRKAIVKEFADVRRMLSAATEVLNDADTEESFFDVAASSMDMLIKVDAKGEIVDVQVAR